MDMKEGIEDQCRDLAGRSSMLPKWVGQEVCSQNRENCRDDQTESNAKGVTYSERPAGQTVCTKCSLAGMAQPLSLWLGSTPLYLRGRPKQFTMKRRSNRK